MAEDNSSDFTELVADQFTGNVVGNVTGNVAGSQTGGWILPTATVRDGSDAPNLVIDPSSYHVSLTKGSAGAYTLAAPGAANVGHVMVIEAGSAFAHVVTVAGLANGNTLTFTNVVGSSAVLYAVSASVWSVLSLGKAAQSQVG
jgi:hypothetical protein